MPQTVYDFGELITSRLKLGLTPDGSTAVSVAVTKPNGSSQSVTGPLGPTNIDEYTAQWNADLAGGGDYVAVWTVTGTGSSVTPKVYNVRPLPTASDDRPSWVPFLSQVADYVPWLTVDTVTPGSQIEYLTFNGRTNPTDEQAQRILDGAVSTIVGPFGAVPESLWALAQLVVSLRCAAAVQRAYPRSAADLAAADALDRRADVEMSRLTTAPNMVGTPVRPYWQFPDSHAWGDVNVRGD